MGGGIEQVRVTARRAMWVNGTVDVPRPVDFAAVWWSFERSRRSFSMGRAFARGAFAPDPVDAQLGASAAAGFDLGGVELLLARNKVVDGGGEVLHRMRT